MLFRSSIRRTFLTDAFLEATIAREAPDGVADNTVPGLVVRCRELFRSDGHAHRVRDSLTLKCKNVS